jgi:hypothetical protein
MLIHQIQSICNWHSLATNTVLCVSVCLVHEWALTEFDNWSMFQRNIFQLINVMLDFRFSQRCLWRVLSYGMCAMSSDGSQQMFRRNMKHAANKRSACSLLHAGFSSSTLKMKAIFSSKMSNDFHRTAPHYIPEDKTLQIGDMLEFRSLRLWQCYLVQYGVVQYGKS